METDASAEKEMSPAEALQESWATLTADQRHEGFFSLPREEAEELFISIALLSLAIDAFVYSAVLRLRRTEPHLPRLYRAKGYPWLPLLVVVYAVSVVVAAAWADPSSTIRGLIALLLSVPAFLWLKSRRAQEPSEEQVS